MAVFNFKQFSIHQEEPIFKVNTDGVLLGAWATVDQKMNGLDIGTGTGLIAMACAQRNEKIIFDAVDVDKSSAQQAKENFQASKFADRITAHHASIQTFALSAQKKYDLIISNPPYFKTENGIVSNTEKHIARQTSLLSYEDLLAASVKLMHEQGHLNVIFPYVEGNEFIALAKKYGLFLHRKTAVKGRHEKPIERLLMSFSYTQQEISEEELTIQKSGVRHDYTEEYVELVKDYYTIL